MSSRRIVAARHSEPRRDAGSIREESRGNDAVSGLPGHLGPAAQAYVESFPKGEIAAFPLTPLDRTGLPVWVVALFPEDERLANVMPYGVGYGATDEQAIRGGLGECAEMIFSVLKMPGVRRTSPGTGAPRRSSPRR